MDQDKYAREIAESFVNGNISWVKEKIKNNLSLGLKVRKVLEESNLVHEVESFDRIFMK